MALQFRKQKDRDEWMVFGPSSELRVGSVSVNKKDGGSREVNVVRLSKEFDVDGVPHRYGYIEQERRRGDCLCDESGCCRPRCHCTSMCACKGGPVFDCLG